MNGDLLAQRVEAINSPPPQEKTPRSTSAPHPDYEVANGPSLVVKIHLLHGADPAVVGRERGSAEISHALKHL